MLGFFAASHAAGHWKSLLLFFNSVPFALEDPVFNRDIGFYIFRLPAISALYNWLNFTLSFTFLATASIYLLYRGIQYTPQALSLTNRARTHLLVLIAAILLVKSAGYMLDTFELLYSSRGAAFGASYADIYASLPTLAIYGFAGPDSKRALLRADLSHGLQIHSRRRGEPARRARL